MQVKKQQLEADVEQQTHSKLGKEYIKVIYWHPAITYMNSIGFMISEEEDLGLGPGTRLNHSRAIV